MKTQFNPVLRRTCQKSSPPARLDDRSKAQQSEPHENTVQLIYAHLPPAVVLAAEQHLRAQTNIEQRAHELWFSPRLPSGRRAGRLDPSRM